MQVDIFQGYNVRTEVKNGAVLFNLSDVHTALGVGKPADTVNRLKESYVDTIDTPTQFGVKPMHYVSERGLIRVLQTSRSPKAVRDKYPVNEADVKRLLTQKGVIIPGRRLDVYSGAITKGYAVRRPSGKWGGKERFQARFTTKTLEMLLAELAPLEEVV